MYVGQVSFALSVCLYAGNWVSFAVCVCLYVGDWVRNGGTDPVTYIQTHTDGETDPMCL